jgi:2,3-bisphosphoglycerate-independent phosphoglycerate mutase
MNKTGKCALVILDGWGIGDKSPSDAIYHAKTPFMDSLMQDYPSTTLTTFGEAVGLPAGQMGNSEVGHLNIGAGRIVYQQLLLINKAFEKGEVKDNIVLKNAVNHAQSHTRKVHLAGLVSDGGVHASLEHLKGLCAYFNKYKDVEVYIHCFLDGRDTDPHSGTKYLKELQDSISGTNAKIATVVGRYYAMDRDQRWERVKKAYDLMVNGVGEKSKDAIESVKGYYKKGVSDEFMEPILLEDNGIVKEDDVFLCFNYRTDRGRQITRALTQENFHEYNMHTIPLHYCTMTMYDERFKDIPVVFGTQEIKMTLGEYLSANGLTQIRAAETEKYPHVTFFFSGGEESEFPGEKRILENSPKVATYDLQPEMSAPLLTDKLLVEFEKANTDFMCINYANTDMVGHTGVYPAIVKAAETVDSCLEKIVNKGLENGYSFIVIADHGNADYALNPDNTPNTAHSTNPVPCVLVSPNKDLKLHEGILADVAPTILKVMGLPKPIEMTGNALY